MSEARQDDKAIPAIDELAKPVTPVAVGTAQAHELVEPQRMSDHVHLNWCLPRTKLVPGHVAINYFAHSAVELRDWPNAITDVVRKHSGQYVIVIGPPLPARDNKAAKVREIALTAGALWKNAGPGGRRKLACFNFFMHIWYILTTWRTKHAQRPPLGA